MSVRSGPILALASCLLWATGCQTYQQQNRAAGHWQTGDLAGAEREATTKADKEANSGSAIIWRLEQAAILRGEGKYEESNRAFDLAQEGIDRYAMSPKVKLAREAAALLSNQANMPYEGRAYDGIMLNTYKALNYLQLGQPDKARVELTRAYQREQDAVEENRKRIEKIQQELAQDPNNAQAQRASNDPKLKSTLAQTYSAVDNIAAYGDYVNPFTVYLDGLFFMVNAAGGSDLEHARKSLLRVSSCAAENDAVKADLASIDSLLSGQELPPTTYVIFETGRAPVRDQLRIDIPTFWPKLPYLGAAFPQLHFQSDYLPNIAVVANGAQQTPGLVASMDSVVGRDFKNELPTIITKTLIASAIKAAATYGAWQATRNKKADGTLDDGGIPGAIVLASATLYQYAVNIANLRTWSTLPKEFRVCRVPTPPDRTLQIVSPRSGEKKAVTLCDGTINLVYVKSISATSPLLVSQTKLK